MPQDTKGKIYDLGSGWGSIVLPLARSLPDCDVIGYELSPIPWLASKFRSWLACLPNLRIDRKNFFGVPLQDASIVICYLFPGAMQKLKMKFEEELQPGTIVISNTFAIPSWTPDQTLTIPTRIMPTKLYLYTKR